jgi:hypothetical protein
MKFDKVRFNRLLTRVREVLTEPFLLLIAFFTSLTIAPLFQQSFSNPFHISNQLNTTGYNPSNNYLQIMLIIVVTLALFLLMRRLYATKYAWVIKIIVVCILLSNHFFFNMLHIAQGYFPTDIIYANGPQSMDNFHSGEQLAPASAFLSGQSLYDQIFFLRGAGVDVFVPLLGFALFGKSIGSFLLINHLLMLATMLGFFGLIATLIKGTFKYIIAITLFYVSNSISLVQIRDIPVWIVMGLVFYLFMNSNLSILRKRIVLAAIGLLSSLELYIAIDRALLLVSLAVMTAAVLAIVTPNNKNVYSFRPSLWKKNIQSSLYIGAGLAAGFVLPGIAIGWNSFVAFLRMTFIEIPEYGGLLVSTRFPTLFTPEYLIWGPVIIAIATGYLLFKLFVSRTSKELNILLPLLLVFAFSLLVIKAGANRIHILKMATVITPLFFVAFITLVYAIRIAYKRQAVRMQLLSPIVMLAIGLIGFSQLDFSKLLHQPVYTRHDLVQYLKMPKTPDEYWMKAETKLVRDYIVTHTDQRDYIYVFPSNPAYYYLTNRQNSSRFYISWFADPQPYTDELMRDLKKNMPKMIVYEDASWMDAPDDISMKDRLPEVSEWIEKNYQHKIKVGNATILTRE